MKAMNIYELFTHKTPERRAATTQRTWPQKCQIRGKKTSLLRTLSSGSEGQPEKTGNVTTCKGRGKRGRPRKRRGAGGRGGGVSGRGHYGQGKKRRGNMTAREQRRQEVETAVASRQALLQEKIETMDSEEMRGILVEMANEEPSIIQKIMDRRRMPVEEAPSPTPHEEPDLPPWCVCRRCRVMPTPQEEICCGYRPEDCESQLPNFRLVCLDAEVLRVAQTYRRDFLANAADRDPSREKRHTGYRQYILWKHGRLGEGNRMAIPSCCVWAIRDAYPDAFGFYIGFKEGRLG